MTLVPGRPWTSASASESAAAAAVGPSLPAVPKTGVTLWRACARRHGCLGRERGQGRWTHSHCMCRAMHPTSQRSHPRGCAWWPASSPRSPPCLQRAFPPHPTHTQLLPPTAALSSVMMYRIVALAAMLFVGCAARARALAPSRCAHSLLHVVRRCLTHVSLFSFHAQVVGRVRRAHVRSRVVCRSH